MAKDRTPMYVVQISDGRSHMTPQAWNSRQAGRPTEANLATYVVAYAKSLELGGCNDHISKTLGVVPYPTSAEIRRNVRGGNGPVVARWKAAMFQAW